MNQERTEEKSIRRFVIIGIILLITVVILLVTKGAFTSVFSLTTAGSWLLFIWFLLSILFFFIFLGIAGKIELLASLTQGWFLAIYLLFSFFIIINLWWQVIPLEKMGREGTEKIKDTPKVSACLVKGLVQPEEDTEIIKNNNFDQGVDNWKVEIWFEPAEDKYDQVFVSQGVATFFAPQGTPNSRAGLMQDLNIDVSGAKSIILKARIKATQSVLGGSGQQGREAPVALGIVYYDENCVLHGSLSEDPKSTGNRAFWHGFYFQDPTGKEINDFAAKVINGEWYEYQYNLSELKPKIIKNISVEGAGWAPREGSVDWVSLKISK